AEKEVKEKSTVSNHSNSKSKDKHAMFRTFYKWSKPCGKGCLDADKQGDV
ncbi:hypothetical protein Tco_0582422, partial [Tanacetum coccineum]